MRVVRSGVLKARAPAVTRAILSDEVITVARMATTDERVRKLEVRVDVLETWAGPGQTGALADGQRKIRADLAKIHKTQDRHGRLLGQLVSDVAILKTDAARRKPDVAELRSDMAGAKATLGEILRRLPAVRD